MKKSELRAIIREEVQSHLQESALAIAAGAVVLGILGYKALVAIFKKVVGDATIKSLKNTTDINELKLIARQIAEKAISEAGKHPMQVAIWKKSVDEMITNGDIKNAWDLMRTIKGIDAIIQ